MGKPGKAGDGEGPGQERVGHLEQLKSHGACSRKTSGREKNGKGGLNGKPGEIFQLMPEGRRKNGMVKAVCDTAAPSGNSKREK